MRHPTRHQLVAYAESLVDRRMPVSARLSGHVKACRQCTAEVRQIRASFEFTGSAHGLEPSPDLTAQILLEARRARQTEAEEKRWRSPVWTALKSAACLAIASGVAVAVFSMALGSGPGSAHPAHVFAAADAVNSEAMTASLERAGDQIKRLSSAVRVDEGSVGSLLEMERLRTVGAIGADIAAAKAALERNPGCIRATHIVNANIERGAQTLRDLYVDQSF